MRWLFPFLVCGSCFGQVTADFICTMDGTNDGRLVDVNVATQCTHNTTVGAGTWSFDSGVANAKMFVSNNAALPFHTPASVNGFTYAGGSQGWVSDESVATNFITYRFNGPGTNKVSFGYFITVYGLGSSSASLDDVQMTGQGEFSILGIHDNQNNPATPKFSLETQGFAADFANITNGVRYWVTVLYDQTSLKATADAFETVNWSLIGTTNGVLLNDATDRMRVGRSDAHQQFPSVRIERTGLVASYGTGTFPLGPGGGSITSFKQSGLTYSGLTFK